MIRDKLKNSSYFENYIISQNQRIQKFTAVLNTLTDDSKITQCARYLASFYRNLISAKYSIGASKPEIKRITEEYLKTLTVCQVSDYEEMVDVLSLVYLLDFSNIDISYLLNFNVFDDGLVLTLKNFIGGNRSVDTTSLKYPDYYSPFYKYISNRMSFESFANYMNNNWYVSSKESYWYGSHLSDQNIYPGYWCWLAAAMLKAKETTYNSIYIPSEII